jgi:hypothetical protein
MQRAVHFSSRCTQPMQQLEEARTTIMNTRARAAQHTQHTTPRLAHRSNTQVVSVETAGSRAVAKLKIRPEPFTEGTDKKCHSQWFYFKASNVRGKECTFDLVNASEASYPDAWLGSWAVISTDRETWVSWAR